MHGKAHLIAITRNSTRFARTFSPSDIRGCATAENYCDVITEAMNDPHPLVKLLSLNRAHCLGKCRVCNDTNLCNSDSDVPSSSAACSASTASLPVALAMFALAAIGAIAFGSVAGTESAMKI